MDTERRNKQITYDFTKKKSDETILFEKERVFMMKYIGNDLHVSSDAGLSKINQDRSIVPVTFFDNYEMKDNTVILDVVKDEIGNYYFLVKVYRHNRNTHETKIIDKSKKVILGYGYEPNKMVYWDKCLYVICFDNIVIYKVDLNKKHVTVFCKCRVGKYKAPKNGKQIHLLSNIVFNKKTSTFYVTSRVRPYFQKISKEGIVSSLCNSPKIKTSECLNIKCDDIREILFITFYDMPFECMLYDLKKERIHCVLQFHTCISDIDWNPVCGELYIAFFKEYNADIQCISFEKV